MLRILVVASHNWFLLWRFMEIYGDLCRYTHKRKKHKFFFYKNIFKFIIFVYFNLVVILFGSNFFKIMAINRTQMAIILKFFLKKAQNLILKKFFTKMSIKQKVIAKAMIFWQNIDISKFYTIKKFQPYNYFTFWLTEDGVIILSNSPITSTWIK